MKAWWLLGLLLPVVPAQALADDLDIQTKTKTLAGHGEPSLTLIANAPIQLVKVDLDGRREAAAPQLRAHEGGREEGGHAPAWGQSRAPHGQPAHRVRAQRAQGLGRRAARLLGRGRPAAQAHREARGRGPEGPHPQVHLHQAGAEGRDEAHPRGRLGRRHHHHRARRRAAGQRALGDLARPGRDAAGAQAHRDRPGRLLRRRRALPLAGRRAPRGGHVRLGLLRARREGRRPSWTGASPS